jgi:hypothetical protein
VKEELLSSVIRVHWETEIWLSKRESNGSTHYPLQETKLDTEKGYNTKHQMPTLFTYSFSYRHEGKVRKRDDLF